MTNKENLYWAVYKNLENELLQLSNEIHFDDYQLGVYSVKICDLLLRTSVEIEAISKELYYENGGPVTYRSDGKTERPPYFDSECMAFLEPLWKLSKKQVAISATTFYFEETQNRVLFPLDKVYRRGKCKWNKAYQSVKHNRTLDITEKKRGKSPQGNLENLIAAMASLYILNVFCQNKSFSLNKTQKIPDEQLGSKIFTVKTEVCNPKYPDNEHIPDESATYIIRPTSESYRAYYRQKHICFCKQCEKICKAGYEPPKNEEGEEIGIEYDKLYQLALDFGGTDLLSEIISMEKPSSKKYDDLIHEAMLNKGKFPKIKNN